MHFLYPNDGGDPFYISEFITENETEAIEAGYVGISDEDYIALTNHAKKWSDGQLVPHLITDAEKEEQKLQAKQNAEEQARYDKYYELKSQLSKIMEDIEQEQLGIVRDDYALKRAQAAEIINELRVLEGKLPRKIV